MSGGILIQTCESGVTFVIIARNVVSMIFDKIADLTFFVIRKRIRIKQKTERRKLV
jgi:hypothetical protein